MLRSTKHHTTTMRRMRTEMISPKILICLTFWEGDRADAMNLARLLADLQPGPGLCREADFLFVARFDAKHDQSTINYVSRKFKVFTHISKRRGTGWPTGCTELFFGAFEWIYHKMAAYMIPQYKAILNIEADSLPLVKDAIQQLSALWDRLPAGTCVAGPWLENGVHEDLGHINGGACLLSGRLDFLKWLVKRAGISVRGGGWDFVLAPQFREWGWYKMPQIQSLWQVPINEELFHQSIQRGIIYSHGHKGDLGVKLVRRHLMGQAV